MLRSGPPRSGAHWLKSAGTQRYPTRIRRLYGYSTKDLTSSQGVIVIVVTIGLALSEPVSIAFHAIESSCMQVKGANVVMSAVLTVVVAPVIPSCARGQKTMIILNISMIASVVASYTCGRRSMVAPSIDLAAVAVAFNTRGQKSMVALNISMATSPMVLSCICDQKSMIALIRSTTVRVVSTWKRGLNIVLDRHVCQI